MRLVGKGFFYRGSHVGDRACAGEFPSVVGLVVFRAGVYACLMDIDNGRKCDVGGFEHEALLLGIDRAVLDRVEVGQSAGELLEQPRNLLVHVDEAFGVQHAGIIHIPLQHQNILHMAKVL